jgi:hypothetical protein
MPYIITKQQYRDEWVVAFQRGETILKERVTREMMVNGLTANFSVQAAAGRMSERGTNGLIPSRNRTDSNVPVTLKEKHTKETRPGFDVFTAPANLREAMQNASALTAAREIDATIIDALATATNSYNSGSAVTLTYGKVVDIISTMLQNNAGDEVTCVWTPKAWARILTFAQFTSVDYVDSKVLTGSTVNKPAVWLGATHLVHTGLTGMGTATAQNYCFARAAVGHAIANDMVMVDAGYNGEDDYSYDRATIYDGGAILQQAGVLKVVTDDTAAFS